jgi:hypothetical protein
MPGTCALPAAEKHFPENLPIITDEKRTMDRVNMSHHDYREEPNERFSPDKTMVFFTSNLIGASYVSGVR